MIHGIMTKFSAKKTIFFAGLCASLLLSGCIGEKERQEGRVMAPPRNASPDYSATARDPSLPPPPAGPFRPAAPEIKIGLLLPMSGQSSEIGKALQDAALLALSDKYATTPPTQITATVKLIPKNTGDDPSGAGKAAEEAAAEGARVFIGPLFSNSISAVSPVARRKGLPVFALSNSNTLRDPGVFQMGFMPEAQVKRVMEYAQSQGHMRFYALLPSTPYGKRVADAFNDALDKANLAPVAIQFYPENADLGEVMAAYVKKIPNPMHKPAALLLAERGSRLLTLFKALEDTHADLSKMQIMGTGLWEEGEHIRMPQLTGAWFATAPIEQYRSFEQRFMAAYKYRPPRIASVAYDAVALVSTLAMMPEDKGFTSETLRKPSGFSGPANGIFRFTREGLNERALSVLQITPRGLVTLSPAQSSFGK